jgi:hypothetical protein
MNEPIDNRYTVLTQSGHRYYINSKNQIIRTDRPFSPSDSWTFIGLVNRYGRYITMAHQVSGPTVYRNGKGRYWLMDSDHGTRRQWSDRIIHIDVTGGKPLSD